MLMELRHLRYFIVMGEELHLGRAGARLHLDQSALSRSMKELEDDLSVRLFERTTRSTRLTYAGQVFLDEARRVLTAVHQARATVLSAGQGYRGHLRIAISDALAQPRMTELFALCREKEPDVELRIFEMPVAQLIKALQQDEIDAGFTLFHDSGEGYTAEPLWHDDVAIAMPARHPLLSRKRVTVADALQYPLILCHPEMCRGGYQYVEAMLSKQQDEHGQPTIAEHVSSHESMLMMIGAGYGVGFAINSQIGQFQRLDVVVRPMESGLPPVTTYLMRRTDAVPSEQFLGFIERARKVGGLSSSDASPDPGAPPAAPV